MSISDLPTYSARKLKTKKKRSSPSPSKKAAARKAIPNSVKREVRQRCGFGCVICGLPLYEYEHMLEWAVVKRHVASEMTLLCPNHHREKTNGLLSPSAVAEANDNPINKRGESSPYNFHLQPASAVIRIGDCTFIYNGDDAVVSSMVALSINAEPMVWFRFQDGNLLLNLSLYDEKNKLIVKIRDNELVYSTEPWDVTFVGKTLKIQTASRKTALTLTVSPAENLISIDDAKLRFSGYEVDVTQKGIFVGGKPSGFSRCTFIGAAYLLNFGKIPAGVHMCASIT